MTLLLTAGPGSHLQVIEPLLNLRRQLGSTLTVLRVDHTTVRLQ